MPAPDAVREDTAEATEITGVPAGCPVVLFALMGPLQSWGTAATGLVRGTDAVPSKSGVVGLVAAALGRDRNADLGDLFGLDFAVRVDLPGKQVTDHQTILKRIDRFEAQTVPTVASMGPLMVEPTPLAGGEGATQTSRDYLADAVFTVALAGDDELVEKIRAALCAPVFGLFLGRRACPAEFVEPVIELAADPVAALGVHRFRGWVFDPEDRSVRRRRDGGWTEDLPERLPVHADAGLVPVDRRLRTGISRDMVTARHDRSRTFVPREFAVTDVLLAGLDGQVRTDDDWGVLL